MKSTETLNSNFKSLSRSARNGNHFALRRMMRPRRWRKTGRACMRSMQDRWESLRACSEKMRSLRKSYSATNQALICLLRQQPLLKESSNRWDQTIKLSIARKTLRAKEINIFPLEIEAFQGIKEQMAGSMIWTARLSRTSARERSKVFSRLLKTT